MCVGAVCVYVCIYVPVCMYIHDMYNCVECGNVCVGILPTITDMYGKNGE